MEELILEKVIKHKFYHGRNNSKAKHFRKRGYPLKAKYWTNQLDIAKMYGNKIETKNVSLSVLNSVPTYNFNGREFNQDYRIIGEIEQNLLKGKQVDIWGQSLKITPKTRYVLITDIVDTPDGAIDVDDDDYAEVSIDYLSDIIIEKL